MAPIKIFLSTFSLIFLAELPDKTALATILLATRNRAAPVFLGASLAFLVQSFVAICFGSLLGQLPAWLIHITTSLLFLFFALQLWFKKDEKVDDENPPTLPFGKAFWKSFMVIFIAEWGDLTQIATATLVARYHAPLVIFSAASLALCAVAAIAILLGSNLKRLMKTHTLQHLAALAFLAVSLWSFYSFFTGR